MNVISEEAAVQELNRIIDFWEVDPEGETWEQSRKKLLQIIGKGRIVLDEEKEEVALKLVKPVELENGNEVSELRFHEPTAADLKVMDKYKDTESVARSLHLASKMTGQALGVVERISSRDMSAVGAVSALFF